MQNYVNQFNCNKSINQRASTSNSINQTCFPLSLATNLLTNHGEIQEQITRNCIDHHSISKSNRNQSIQYYQTQIQEKQASSKNQIASK